MKSLRTIKLLTLSCILLMAVSAFKCGGDKNDGIYRGRIYEKDVQYTPKGVRVASGTKVNKALFNDIDAGLGDTFRIAQAPPNNYTLYRTYTDYNVWLFPRSDKCINAGFLVDATGSPYEGGEFDKNADPNICWICAAGMTMFEGGISNPQNPARPGMIVVDDAATIRLAVRFEAEHSVLFYSDPRRYMATMYHPPPHPILTDGSGLLADNPLPFDAISANVAKKDICILVTK